MPTRNVVLTEHQADLVETLVKTGRYQNASEVLREGLRLVEQRELQDKAKLQALRDAAKVGFDELDRGEYRAFDSPTDLATYLDEISGRVSRRSRG